MREEPSAAPVQLPVAPAPLPVSVIDAHTHLASTAERIRRPVAEILEMASAVGVSKVVDVGCDVYSSAESVGFAERFPTVVSCVAIHPNDAARLGDGLDAGLAELEALIAGSPKVRGVGETGLDYYRTTDPAGQARQKLAFARHIGWAKEHQLPLVVHDRDAHADILAMLDSEGAPDKVMMHCFSGDADFAQACMERGFWLSFPGTVTFKANEPLREALDIAAADRILVETDAPYLTPMPNRGKPNGPYLIPDTVRFMAARRGA
ncbi:MAG: TatD family hydrolase, partial [Propionibacteriaceae bacterium]|nr:TatD family hydrolase [Propionibacteriaceae bacterium]